MRSMYMLRTVALSACLGLGSLALPLLAHAGGPHVSVGIGLLLPEPVVVVPQPVVVQPAPIVVAPAPVVVRKRWLPPGIAKKYYGYPKHWKRHHHDDD